MVDEVEQSHIDEVLADGHLADTVLVLHRPYPLARTRVELLVDIEEPHIRRLVADDIHLPQLADLALPSTRHQSDREEPEAVGLVPVRGAPVLFSKMAVLEDLA